jgi:hypothetical protein
MRNTDLTNAQRRLLLELLANEHEATREHLEDCAANEDEDEAELARGWLAELEEVAAILRGDEA